MNRNSKKARSGLRQSKKQATHDALARAAGELAIESGFSRVNAQEVAERARVSTRTFHNYFPSREHALLAYMKMRIEEWAEIIEADTSQRDAIDAVANALTQIADAFGPSIFVIYHNMLIQVGSLGPYQVRHFNAETRRRISLALARREGRSESNEQDFIAIHAGFLAMETAVISTDTYSAAHGEDSDDLFMPFLRTSMETFRTMAKNRMFHFPLEVLSQPGQDPSSYHSSGG